LQVLKESSKAIITILDLHELLEYLIHSIKTSLGVDNVCLYLKGSDGQYAQPRSARIDEATCYHAGLEGNVVEWIKHAGQVVIREELERKLSQEEFGFLNAYMKKAEIELFLPLFYKGHLQGILALGEKGNSDPYCRSDIDLLEALAGHGAVAIENARLYEEARAVQESLLESQERFRSLIETTSDWVWETNDRGVYTYVSSKIRDILGYEPEEVLGKTFFDFMPREEARRAADFFVSLTRHQKPFMMNEHVHLHKTGRIVIVETSGVPIFDKSGQFIGYRGIDRDVTQRRALEGQLRYAQKMEAIGRLAAGVAHDFNNINTGVVGYASLLNLRLKKEDPNREFVDQILAATERAANLTRSLLAFSKKPVVNRRPLNLNEVVRSMEKLMAGLIGSDIEFRVNLCDKDLTIEADPVQVERIIMNLALNARDAMTKGGCLIIETREVDIDDEFTTTYGYGKPGRYAQITVADNGAGIDQLTLKKIFEPFFTTKGEGKGTGFGLSIVYDIVKLHMGYVNVTSTLGKGTTFHVYLPFVHKTADQALFTASAAADTANGTILVADNDGEDRRFIKAALEGIGYRVVEAIDGEDAVQKCSDLKEKAHILILDIIMTKMNGKEVYRTIKKKRPDIKVLFTSSYPEDVMFQKGMLDANMNFILKPFSSKELLDRIKAIQ
jgi:PAS domain S-box-containing protein